MSVKSPFQLLFTNNCVTYLRVLLGKVAFSVILFLGIVIFLTSGVAHGQCVGCNITNPTTNTHFAWLNQKVCFTANTTVVNNAVVGNANCTIEICSGAAVHFQHNANLAVQACTKTIHNGSYSHGGAGTYAGFVTCTDLAVVFGDITADRNSGQIIINWETFIQVNTDYFVVMRSENNRVWTSVDTVYGAGNSRERLEYELIDPMPPHGDVIYKIVEVDFNGENDESNIIGVEAAQFQEVNVFPNPATWQLSFDQGIENPQKVEFVNNLGQVEVSQSFSTTYTLTELDISTLSSGSYELIVTNDEGVFRRTFIKN